MRKDRKKLKESSEAVIDEIISQLGVTKLPNELKDIPFSEAIWPWIKVAKVRLRKRLSDKHLLTLLSPKVYRLMQIALIKRWSDLCAPTMLFEMKIKRLGLFLRGNTPRERYLDYIQMTYLKPESLRFFFDEYTELARLVGLFLLFWVENTAEFLERLHNDLPDISEFFMKGSPIGQICDIKLDIGDTHNEGRAVSELTFSSGKSLVYKPKKIHIVKLFHSFTCRLNELGLKPALKGYKVLPREDYGWEEKVEHTPCHNKKEVARYFERAGSYLCLMHLLAGIDMHYENVVVFGEFPMLIDLETLFHGQMANIDLEYAQNTLQNSVLATGLLPFFLFGKMKEKGVDISALGRGGEQILHPVWQNIHTDEMECVEEAKTSLHMQNVVFCKKEMIAAKDYLEEIIKGFKNTFAFFQKKKTILEKEGWIEKFSNQTIRIIVRPTRFYQYLLENLYKPHSILNPSLQEEQLELLQRTFGNDNKFPDSLIEEEKRQLLAGDVPYFYTFPNTADLFSKHCTLKNSLEMPSLKSVKIRIEQMGEEDLRLQETFIRRTFKSKDASVHMSNLEENQGKTSFWHFSEKEILESAHSLAIALKKEAYVSKDGSLGWINLEPNLATEQVQLQFISDNLYSGRMGIALFFAYLAKTLKNDTWKEECLNTLKPLLKTIEKGKEKHILGLGIGGMAGAGGIIYGLLQIGKLLNISNLIENAQKIAHCIEEKHIAEDTHFDLVFGIAGLILSLLSFHPSFSTTSILKKAHQCGEHLYKKMAEISLEKDRDKTLLGLSHGTAGMAYALLKLSHITSNEKFHQAANIALAYERRHFSSPEKNWPNFSMGRKIYTCSWCHGATGIGLSRLASLAFINDAQIMEEINTAIDTTKKYLVNGPVNLCCGALGRLEFLQEAKKTLGKDLDSPIQDLLSHIFHRIKEIQDSEENPGFMQGKAGLGFTLLRLLDKEEDLRPKPFLLQ